VTIERCRARIDQMERQKADLEAAIAELAGFVRLLEDGERGAGTAA